MAFIWFYPQKCAGPTNTSISPVVMSVEKNRCITYESSFDKHAFVDGLRMKVRDMPLFFRRYVVTRAVVTTLVVIVIALIAAILFSYIGCQPVNAVVAVFAVSALPFYFLFYSAYPICKVNVYFLQSGEPFPFIEKADTISPKEHIFAIRLLSWNANSRYNPFFKSPTTSCSYRGKYFSMNDRNSVNNKRSIFESDVLPDYWSLLYFSLERQLRGLGAARTGESFRIAGLMNRNSVFIFFVMLAVVFFVALLPKEIRNSFYLSQLRMLFGIAALVWAAYAIVSYRKKIFDLIRWESECKRRPFLNCPIFRATQSQTKGVVWVELDPDAFADPVREFGVNIEVVVKVVVAVMVVIFLTMLQLISE